MNMTISSRIAISLSTAIISMILVGILGVWQIQGAQQRFEYFQDNVTQAIKDLTTVNKLVYESRILAYRYMLYTDSEKRAAIESAIADANSLAEQSLKKYEKDDITNDADRALLETDKADLASFVSVQKKLIETSKANDTPVALALLEEGGGVRESNKTLQKVVADHIIFNEKLGSDLRAANGASYARAFWTLATIISLATILTGGLAVQLQRIIRRGLGGMQDSLQHVEASLDLTRKAPVERMDEIGRTATAFNDLLTRVTEVIGSVRRSAESVSVASREIASGNTDLSARTEEQASSLEETAASMTQLTETVKQNADNARQANALATSATELADAGNEAVQGMVGTIENISGSSGKISEITGVIEGIAFQTNILALNAAVEAARAGEQGRGFAVVASEVRSLAQRSSAAAKEIKGLIESSVAMIQDGSKQATEVGATMGQVKQAIKRVSDIVGEITAASEEQSRGIEQVNQAVGQMDEVTQQNAALVEQAAAAAQSLEEQATRLKEAVSVFKVADMGQVAARMEIPQSKALLLASRHPVTRRARPSKPRIAPTSIAGKPAAETDTAKTDWETF